MSAVHGDPALEALMLPFDEGALAWPRSDASVDGAPSASVLFLRARDGWPLRRHARSGLVCEQGFKPAADALQRAGYEVRAADDATYPLVLLLPPRQRDEARALFAHALARVRDGGIVVASVANDEGAKSAQADFARIAGALDVRSKHKCRVFWTRPGQAGDVALAAQWRLLDAPRAVVDGRFLSRPGIFAWDRVDPASRLLAEQFPDDLHGRAADLGAGYGYLSAELLRRCPGITALDAYEAEARALELARINLAPFSARVAIGHHWHDVTTGLPDRYDVIVGNPPFHAQGRAWRPDIGQAFIAAAAQALDPGGRLWLVANRHLPYESVLDARFGTSRIVAQRDGYKVVEAVKASVLPPLKKGATGDLLLPLKRKQQQIPLDPPSSKGEDKP